VARLWSVRGADLGVAQHVEGDGKSIHPLFEQRLDRLRRHVAPVKPVPPVVNDGIDARISDPPFDDDADGVDVVNDDFARRQMMTGGDQPIRQRGA